MDGDVPVEVYNTNGDAKMALSNGEIDAVVADLPTAFAVANELRDGADGRPIAQCVRRCRAVRHRAGQGQSADPLRVVGCRRLRWTARWPGFEHQWLTDAGKAPVLV